MGSRKKAQNRPPIRTAVDEKLEIFVREYLVDFNSTRAAEAAGYSAKTASAAGSRLLRNVKVQERVKAATAKRIDKLEITGERILQRLAKIGFSEQTRDGDAIRALELLGKWRELGLWKDNVAIEKPPQGKSEEFQKLVGEVRALFGSSKAERGK